MTGRFNLRIAFSLLGFLSTVAQVNAGAAPQTSIAEELVRAVQDKNVLTNQTGKIPSILRLLVSETPFSNHVNINRPVEDSSLNFCLLAHGLSSRTDTPRAILQSGILGNCAYVGVSNVMVCDSEFVDGFLFNYGVFSEHPVDLEAEEHQSAFIAWVLGHELGHVVAGDSTAHFGVANVLDQKQNATVELAQQKETAADLYAARQIERNQNLTRSLEGMLMALIDQEVAEKNGKSASYGVGLHWDYANKKVIQYFANQDHPEFVIRATRILTLVATDTHEQGLKAFVDTFTRHLVQIGGDER